MPICSDGSRSLTMLPILAKPSQLLPMLPIHNEPSRLLTMLPILTEPSRLLTTLPILTEPSRLLTTLFLGAMVLDPLKRVVDLEKYPSLRRVVALFTIECRTSARVSRRPRCARTNP